MTGIIGQFSEWQITGIVGQLPEWQITWIIVKSRQTIAEPQDQLTWEPWISISEAILKE
jgi:hypothetical protein